jgi:hypothetical protein
MQHHQVMVVLLWSEGEVHGCGSHSLHRCGAVRPMHFVPMLHLEQNMVLIL